jgi:hypothetical protein
MNTFTTCGLVAALTITASAAGAQTKTITGEQKTLTATVESIEAATRSVTVKKPDGTYEVFYVPSAIKKFDTLKIGDKVTARYYENVVLQVKAPGETGAGDKSASAVTRAPETAGTAGTSGRSPRPSPRSIRKRRRSPSPGRTAGSTARASKTLRRWPR